MPPYQGFDAGPRFEPPIDDAGCSAATPFFSPAGGGGCVQCNTDQDCPPDLFCFVSRNVLENACVGCHRDDGGRGVGCPAAEACDLSEFFPFCVPDCRVQGQGCPAANYCSLDAGTCIAGCLVDSDCQDAGAVCAVPGEPFGCFGCYGDAGCPPGESCNENPRGFGYSCVPNCVDAGTACPANEMCNEQIGLCVPGCTGDGNCGDGSPVCDTTIEPPICAECATVADCSSSMPGCLQTPSCPTCALKCGACVSDVDCPAGLHCFNETFCGCSDKSECAGLEGTPVCFGLDAGFAAGNCACLSSADCDAGSVCDSRYPFAVYLQGNLFSEPFGGACIPSCAGAAADFCSNNFGSANPVCNPVTGYCVPCTQDSDCTAAATQPWQTPSCIPFEDGGATISYLPFVPTGGGQCGCRSTAACDDGLTCQAPSGPGECVSPCTLIDGIDSCGAQFGGGFCNTFTGLCQQCLDDYDCTGVMSGGSPAPTCSAGNCVE